MTSLFTQTEAIRTARGITIECPLSETVTARMIQRISDNCAAFVENLWEIQIPDGLTIHVVSSWWSLLRYSSWTVIQLILWPVSLYVAYNHWHKGHGFAIRGSAVILVKPLAACRLIKGSEAIFFTRECSDLEKIRSRICGLMTQCASVSSYLASGMSVVSEEKYLGAQVIKPESLRLLQLTGGDKEKQLTAAKRPVIMTDEEVTLHCVRSYWLVRYLMETRPGFVRGLLQKHGLDVESQDRIVASEIGVDDPNQFWLRAIKLIVEHFGHGLSVTEEQLEQPYPPAEEGSGEKEVMQATIKPNLPSAIVSLVFGIVAFFFSIGGGVVASLLGIMLLVKEHFILGFFFLFGFYGLAGTMLICGSMLLGVFSLRQIKREADRWQGRAFAIAGIILAGMATLSIAYGLFLQYFGLLLLL